MNIDEKGQLRPCQLVACDERVPKYVIIARNIPTCKDIVEICKDIVEIERYEIETCRDTYI